MLKKTTRKLISHLGGSTPYNSFSRKNMAGTRKLVATHLKESKAKLGSKELRSRVLSKGRYAK